MTSKRQYYYRAILVTIYFANIIFALQQLGDITDNVNTALADTYMLFDFEPPTASTPTNHGTATARELHSPVKHITFSMVNMATSPFAHHKRFVLCQTTTTTKAQRSTDT